MAKQPPDPLPLSERIVGWLQRINGQYASIMRWAGFLAFCYFASQDQLAVAAAFGGLVPMSFTVGKSGGE